MLGTRQYQVAKYLAIRIASMSITAKFLSDKVLHFYLCRHVVIFLFDTDFLIWRMIWLMFSSKLVPVQLLILLTGTVSWQRSLLCSPLPNSHPLPHGWRGTQNSRAIINDRWKSAKTEKETQEGAAARGWSRGGPCWGTVWDVLFGSQREILSWFAYLGGHWGEQCAAAPPCGEPLASRGGRGGAVHARGKTAAYAPGRKFRQWGGGAEWDHLPTPL